MAISHDPDFDQDLYTYVVKVVFSAESHNRPTCIYERITEFKSYDIGFNVFSAALKNLYNEMRREQIEERARLKNKSVNYKSRIKVKLVMHNENGGRAEVIDDEYIGASAFYDFVKEIKIINPDEPEYPARHKNI